MSVICFHSKFKGALKYYVVAFNDKIPKKLYEVVPRAWMISEASAWFPLYSKCKLEKAVEEGLAPFPKKDFVKYSLKMLHQTGPIST